MAKKDETQENASKHQTNDKPKIILKTKERETIAPTTPVQISIASRPIDASISDGTNSSGKSMPTKLTIHQTTTTAPKDAKESHTGANYSNVEQSHVPTMKKPMPIISDHYQIVSQGFEHLIETNADFYVVGIVGTQASGKSSILNLLIDETQHSANNVADNNLFTAQNGVFKTRCSMEYIFSNMPATEGIQMFITRDRTILLDCSPVLSNPYKKDCILNELDDLKMLIFLLSVCHLLIVVNDNGININYLRLIQCAENMKMNIDQNEKYSPNILFFKNKCANRDFLPEQKASLSSLYREVFKDCKLQMYANNYSQMSDGAIESTEPPLNIFHFPLIDPKSKFYIIELCGLLCGDNLRFRYLTGRHAYAGYPDINILIAEFRQRVFMAPRKPFPAQNQQQTSFTEKNWSHLALAVWESHKNNYFLRKFETFKEKEWATRL